MTEILVHVPHSSTRIPAYPMQHFLRPPEEIRDLAREIADLGTEKLFAVGSDMLICPFSRLAVDVERFEDSNREVMAQRGLGAIYENYYDGKPIRENISPVFRRAEMELIYHAHHRRLTQMTGQRIAAFGRCLILDAHSFGDVPMPLDLDQRKPRPDICIGTDSVHTPQRLRNYLVRAFESYGLRVAVNSPYSGTMVPLPYYGDSRVVSIMIEVNKKLYLEGGACGRELRQQNELLRSILSGQALAGVMNKTGE